MLRPMMCCRHSPRFAFVSLAVLVSCGEGRNREPPESAMAAGGGAAGVSGSSGVSGNAGVSGSSTNPCARPGAHDPDNPCAGLGIFDECLTRGQSFDRRFASDPCCEGLVLKGSDVPVASRGDGSEFALGCGPGNPGQFFCLACGDGNCDAPENYCMCPEDCQNPYVDAGGG